MTFSLGRLEDESGHGTLVSAEQESRSVLYERIPPRGKPSIHKTGVNAQCPAQKEHNSLWLVLMWTQFYWQKVWHRSLLRTPENSCNGSQILPCLMAGMELREPLVTTWAALPALLLFQSWLLQAAPADIVRYGKVAFCPHTLEFWKQHKFMGEKCEINPLTRSSVHWIIVLWYLNSKGIWSIINCVYFWTGMIIGQVHLEEWKDRIITFNIEA